MAFTKLRIVTALIASATLAANIFESLLFHRLPDDPYHLATNFSVYLHFANILSVFGLVGALTEHGPSIAFFASYLILDTVVCAIPRFLVFTLLSNLSNAFCTGETATIKHDSLREHTIGDDPFPSHPKAAQTEYVWNEKQCVDAVWLLQMAMFASVLAATLMQFMGALQVRVYANRLLIRETMQEVMKSADEERTSGRLPVIFEEREEETLLSLEDRWADRKEAV